MTSLANQQTIVALATPAGEGAIGIIRLSGGEAIAMADALFVGKKKLTLVASHTLHFGLLRDGDRLLDEVLVSVFKGPHSYTGDDVVEISCHGSAYILSEVLQAFISRGARLALPGEFTQRAFLNGKLDLSQAESVADIIAAENALQHEMAFSQMRGGYAQVLKQLREELITFAGLIELELDFSQEDVAFADREALHRLLKKLHETVTQLISSFALGNVLKKGIPVAIVGDPNVGKSTLLNALLNEDKAMVSDIAGTTRDVIEDVLVIDGIAFRFLDTAGLRETDDVLEAQGIARSYEKLKTAHVVLYLADIQKPIQELIDNFSRLHFDDHQLVLILLNKVDLLLDVDAERLENNVSNKLGRTALALSAKAGLQINDVKKALLTWVMQHPSKQQGMMVTNARHIEALEATRQSLDTIRDGMAAGISGDLLAIDIRMALFHLGTITGQVEVDRDILGTIFGKFCIGK